MKYLASSMTLTALLVTAMLVTSTPASHLSGGDDDIKPGSNARGLKHGNEKRTYRLYMPRNLAKDPVPLVLAFHGAFTDGAVMEVLTGFNRLADKKSFIVVSPDAVNRIWRFWSKEDVEFIDALLDDLIARQRVDPRRVYVTGISNGAYFSNRLGYDLSKRIAAIAPVAGTMIKAQADAAPRQRLPMPVLAIHGTADRFTGYNGTDLITQKQSSVPAEDFAAWWAGRNSCRKLPRIEKLPDKEDDGTRVERWSFAPEKERDGAEVIFYKVVGGGHTWPGQPLQPEFLLGRTCKDFNATDVIWEFFARHRR